MEDITKLAYEKAGGIEKIEFHPKGANPFTSNNGYMPLSKNAYRINKRQIDNASANFESLTRGTPCFTHGYQVRREACFTP